jgi:hypothetical protein
MGIPISKVLRHVASEHCHNRAVPSNEVAEKFMLPVRQHQTRIRKEQDWKIST